jgi:hypothetical protein
VKALILAIPPFLAACAWQSEPLSIGPDTYRVSANASPARGGQTTSAEMALSSANQKCAQLRKQIVVLEQRTDLGFPANAITTVTFRCE